MKQYAYLVTFQDKRIDGFSKRIFTKFDDIDQFLVQCKKVEVELIPIESKVKDEDDHWFEASGAFESCQIELETLPSKMPRGCTIKATEALKMGLRGNSHEQV